MSPQGDDEGLVEEFVKGVVFTLGAAAAGLVLRRVFRQEPEVLVVAVAADELGVGEDDEDGGDEGGGDEDELDEEDVVEAEEDG